MELFDREKIPFIDITNNKCGYIEKKDDEFKAVLISPLCFSVPDDKGYIEVESCMKTVGDINDGGKLLNEITPRLILPKNLEAKLNSFESIPVMEDADSEVLWSETWNMAMEIAFNVAQRINDTSIIIEDDEQKKQFLCIPIDGIDGNNDFVREISGNISFEEKLKLFNEGFTYRGIYFLKNDIPLFEVEAQTVDFVGLRAAQHLYLLESYNQLEPDECLGIDYTGQYEDNLSPYKLLAAKIEDGELKVREVNNSHGNFLLLDADSNIPSFRICRSMLIGAWCEGGKHSRWSGFIKDKDNILDSFIEWADAMDKVNISSSIFGVSPEIQDELDTLNSSRMGVKQEIRDEANKAPEK